MLHLGDERGTTTTRRVCLWITFDDKSRTNKGVLEPDRRAFEQLERYVVGHDFGAVHLVYDDVILFFIGGGITTTATTTITVILLVGELECVLEAGTASGFDAHTKRDWSVRFLGQKLFQTCFGPLRQGYKGRCRGGRTMDGCWTSVIGKRGGDSTQQLRAAAATAAV